MGNTGYRIFARNPGYRQNAGKDLGNTRKSDLSKSKVK